MIRADSMIISVTGANGFLGRHIIQAAIRREWTVNAIVRRTDTAQLVESIGAKPHIIPDLTPKALGPIIRESNAILHFIGITEGDPADFDRINFGLAKIVLETAIQHDIGRIITPSGLGVDHYGKKPWATNPYFESKMKIEQLFQAQDHPFVIFRPSYILGPGDELLPYMMQDLLNGTIKIAGDGTKPMQPIFVKDASEIFLNAAAGKGLTNEIYDLVGPEIITMNQLIDRVVAVMRQQGLRVPAYRVVHVPLDQASEILGLSQEDVDVTQCDILGDNNPIQRDFEIKLTPLDTAIEAVVRVVQETPSKKDHDIK